MIKDERRYRYPSYRRGHFARRFSMRASNLMWLLGAGASASAGYPTAGDMAWEFKQQLFISQRRVSPRSVADLSSAAIRTQLQAHIDSSENLPPVGASDEMPHCLRRSIQMRRIDAHTWTPRYRGKPSYGHLALATLIAGNSRGSYGPPTSIRLSLTLAPRSMTRQGR